MFCNLRGLSQFSNFSDFYVVANSPLNPAFLKGTMLFPHKIQNNENKPKKTQNPPQLHRSVIFASQTVGGEPSQYSKETEVAFQESALLFAFFPGSP